MKTASLDTNTNTDRVMDWHDQIFIPVHLRHSVGMDHLDSYGELDDENANLLILRDFDSSDIL
jgi:hypothetical protein